MKHDYLNRLLQLLLTSSRNRNPTDIMAGPNLLNKALKRLGRPPVRNVYDSFSHSLQQKIKYGRYFIGQLPGECLEKDEGIEEILFHSEEVFYMTT